MSSERKSLLRSDFNLKHMAMVLGPAIVAGLLVIALTPNRSTSADTTAGSDLVAPATAASTKVGTDIAAVPTSTTTETDADTATEAQSFSTAQREEIGQIVRNYLLTNPEIIIEVSRELERRQVAAQAAEQRTLILDNKASLFRSEHDYVFGNEKGDVNVVEFFDYNCGWCKRALAQIQLLADADKNVRVVMKEMPIFGEDSTFAAKAAMASKKQGKYWDFHVALMEEQRVTTQNTLEIAAKVGLDVDKLKADMNDPAYDKAIRETLQLAESLQIQGTPGFIVDTRVTVGYVPVDGLKAMVSEVREAGCQTCE